MHSKGSLWVRLILSFIGVIFAAAMPLLWGYKESYSRYYANNEVIFVGMLALLAGGLFLHKNKEWALPSQSLLTLAIFNMFDFPILHYSAAIIFFISATYAMWNDKRVSYFGRISLMFYPIFVFDLLWFELIQILVICVFHIINIIKMFRLKIDRKILDSIREEETKNC